MKITTRILLVISFVTVLLAIAAFLFRPVIPASHVSADYSQIFTGSFSDYLLRFSVIFLGLLLTVASLLVTVISVFFHKHSAIHKLANLSIFMFVFVSGWIALPYWTNGLYFVFSAGLSSAFDPKELLPMTLIGEFWRIPVLIFYPVIVLYMIFSLIRFIVIVIKKKKFEPINILILTYNILVIAAYFFTPHYFYWLLD